MRRLTLLLAFCLLIAPAWAQDETADTPTSDRTTATPVAPTATDESIAKEIAAPTENPALQLKDDKMREFQDAPLLRLRILDKVRAESRTYELNVGRTVAYGNLRIRPRACRKSSPLDDPESAAFLQIWEVKPDDSSSWVFSGWMFASSPSLSAMDHPVYDVTVLECKMPDTTPEGVKTDDAVTTDEAAPTDDDVIDDDDDQDSNDTGADESTNDTPDSATAPASRD